MTAAPTLTPTVPETALPCFDAIVMGGGITGIYQAWLLRNQGLSVQGFEAAPDVGGTWFWNRYPGCRLDTESYAYGYFTLNGILPDWQWSERFASQPELLRYVNAAADRMDIRRSYRFNTKVTAAHYDESANLWRLTLDDGSRVTGRYLLSAVGLLSATRMPDIPGVERFHGASFHSSRWPVDDQGQAQHIDFRGKRVGIIGTGATGVQIIPIVARSAAQTYVFQRTPNWCTPLGNHPLTPELLETLRGDRGQFLDFIKSTPTAFPYARSDRKGSKSTAAERQALFESLYNMPGYGIWLAGYRDLLTSKVSNSYLAEFVASKIRQRVKDPAIAEKLIPKHAFGTRRVPMETHYYEVYNQDNVELVDAREAPIECITPAGVRAGGRDIELDVLIYATGFDAITGAIDRIDIRGKGGQALKDAWADGPATFLGLQCVGFPNFFTLVGPHNGASFCNIGVCGALQAEWVADMIGHLHRAGLSYSEPEPDSQERWTAQVYEDFAKTLLAETEAWWVKVTTQPDGSIRRRALVYIGGAPEYRAYCDQVAAQGYAGFTLR